jgi:hypothetical protein
MGGCRRQLMTRIKHRKTPFMTPRSAGQAPRYCINGGALEFAPGKSTHDK